MFLKNYVDARKFKNEMNSLMKKKKVNQQQINKMCSRDLSQKNVMKDSLLLKKCAIKKFLENLCFLIVKDNSFIHFVENIYLIKPLALHLCPIINFPSKK